MTAKRRILAVVGTRPEAVKMAPVVMALRADPRADVRLCVTAQHRELADRILAFFQLRPDVDLDVMQPGQTLAGLTARLFAAVDPMLAAERPDVVLAQGDTTTVMVAALCCFYRRIAFGHVEAGLRTGNRFEPFPEEVNRGVVARTADLHFAPTVRARDNLLRENVPAAAIHVVGNPVIDALLWTAARVDAAPFRPAGGRRLVLVTAHRREHFGAPLAEICAGVRALAARPDVAVLWPVHPNPEVAGPVRAALGAQPNVRLCEPLDYPQMVAAMLASSVILTDSGGVQEEAPALGKPVVVLRDQSERPEGIDAGAAVVAGPHRDRIAAAGSRLLDDAAAYAAMARVRHPYGDGTTGSRIAAVLLGS